jgi:hypothetical protein
MVFLLKYNFRRYKVLQLTVVGYEVKLAPNYLHAAASWADRRNVLLLCPAKWTAF